MSKKERYKRHGGPYDRGAADSYYRRPFSPHYYQAGTGTSQKVTDLTEEEIKDYTAGYLDNEAERDFKNWDFWPSLGDFEDEIGEENA